MALDRIRSSDMLYHNVDHTMMVTLAGQEILKGKQMCDGGISPRDWVEYTVATLFHDIGYVRGVCKGDTESSCVVGPGKRNIKIDEKGSDARLTPYHVDRGKVFVKERLGGELLVQISAETIADYIEQTRFPPVANKKKKKWDELGDLVRAADLIGQLGDPGYLRKIPALFYEFEELGLNEKLGYSHPGQMRDNYATFYWGVVYPYIADAIRYLEATENGRQWVANLFSHVFRIEHPNLK